MQIFVDADACPVVAIIEKIAKENSIPVTLLQTMGQLLPAMMRACWGRIRLTTKLFRQ